MGQPARDRFGKQRTAESTEKQVKALRLFLAGVTYERIAEEVGYHDRSTAHRAIQSALKQRAKERDDLADSALTIQLERLEGIFRTHYALAIDRKNPAQAARSAEVVIKALDRVAKFMGLDAPQRAEVTVVQRDELDMELSAMVAQFRAEADARGVDLPDAPVLDAIAALGAPQDTTDE